MASPTRAPVLALKDVRLADGAKPLFKEKIAVADTFGIPRLLSTPI